MRIKFGKLPVLTAGIAAIGLMGAFTASASADSLTCAVSGSIKLSPGLTIIPTRQNIWIKGRLSGCSGTETSVTEGTFKGHLKTAETVTCATLRGTPGPAAAGSNIIFKWKPRGSGKPSMGTFPMELTESGTLVEGTIGSGAFEKDELKATVSEGYRACSPKGIKRGILSGSISIT
jgi:hypothetical protein